MKAWRRSTLSAHSFFALAAASLAACADGDIAGPLDIDAGMGPSFNSSDVPFPAHRKLILCKIGSNAVFNVDVSGAPSFTVAVNNGECVTAWNYDPTVNPSQGMQFLVAEQQLAPNVVLDSIIKDSTFAVPGSNPPQFEEIRLPTIFGTNEATASVAGSKGATLTFFNHVVTPPPPPPPPPPPGDGEGCTPGYWKQMHHWDDWKTYKPWTKFDDVFENAFPGKTLLQVLGQGGGGLNALGRHTVAALLNAAHSGVEFGLTTTEVIDAFNEEFPGGDYEALKDAFADLNEQGCPLGGRDDDDDHGDDDDDHDRDKCNRDNKWHKKWGSRHDHGDHDRGGRGRGRGHNDRDGGRDHDKDKDRGGHDDNDRDRGRGWGP